MGNQHPSQNVLNCCGPTNNGNVLPVEVTSKKSPRQSLHDKIYLNPSHLATSSPVTNVSRLSLPTSTGSGGRPSSGALSTERCGVGIMFETELHNQYGCCVVEGIAPYSDAFQSKQIEKGDLLWEIDGKSAAYKSLSELSCMIMGPPGSTVELKFKKTQGNSLQKDFSITVTRVSPLNVIRSQRSSLTGSQREPSRLSSGSPPGG